MSKLDPPAAMDNPEAMRRELLYRLLALNCPNPSRCDRVSCRRSGRCAELAKAKRELEPAPARRRRRRRRVRDAVDTAKEKD